MKTGKFTEREIKYLKDNYKYKTRYELSQDLGRKYESVRVKLISLNIKPLDEYTNMKCTWSKMFKFAKSLNPKYKMVSDAFDEYGKENFIKLYNQSLIIN